MSTERLEKLPQETPIFKDLRGKPAGYTAPKRFRSLRNLRTTLININCETPPQSIKLTQSFHNAVLSRIVVPRQPKCPSYCGLKQMSNCMKGYLNP